MSERLEELQQRIRRLDESLKTCSGEHTPRITR